MAMHAGATFVRPLVGRLQDQGHDALPLVEQCVNVVDRYGYDSQGHVLVSAPCRACAPCDLTGVHVCTVPFKVLKGLTRII